MLKEEYAEYCAECRACGVQPQTFTQWINSEYSAKEEAQDRLGNIWDAQDEVEAY